MIVVKNNVDELVECFMLTPKSPGYHNNIKIQKAGIWQGIDAYKDANILVLRDVNFYLDCNMVHNDAINIIKPDKEWCDIHFAERIGGKPLNPGESYKLWPYAALHDGDGFLKEAIFDHTYMERFWPKKAGNILGIKFDGDFNSSEKRFFFTDQPKDITHPNNLGIRFEYGDLNDVIKQLKDNPLTRQAYLPIFFPEDTGSKGNIRVPCTLGYLFEMEEDKLNCTYYIRSCDVYRHLRNDIYLAYCLMYHVWISIWEDEIKETGKITTKLGTLNMKIANLHLFENDTYPLVRKERKLKEYNYVSEQ